MMQRTASCPGGSPLVPRDTQDKKRERICIGLLLVHFLSSAVSLPAGLDGYQEKIQKFRFRKMVGSICTIPSDSRSV